LLNKLRTLPITQLAGQESTGKVESDMTKRLEEN